MHYVICDWCGKEVPADVQHYKGATKHADGSQELEFDLCFPCCEHITDKVRQTRVSLPLPAGAEPEVFDEVTGDAVETAT